MKAVVYTKEFKRVHVIIYDAIEITETTIRGNGTGSFLGLDRRIHDVINMPDDAEVKVGDLLSSIATTDQTYILNEAKKVKIEELNRNCNDLIYVGFTASNGHTFGLKITDQLNLSGQKDELKDDPTIVEVPWKTEDVGYITLTRADWLKMYSEAKTFIKKNVYHCGNLKGRVNAIVIDTNTTLDQALVKISLITWATV